MEVLRQIGGGSYGEIWMARSVTDTLRAVKLVYRNDFDDDRTFEREFEGILKYEPVAREHPGLVDILHVGRDRRGEEEFYYYVMELGDDVERGSNIRPADYEPRTLRSDMLRAGRRPLAVGFCAEAGARLAGALAHLHAQGLAHRDVKPSNVIFVKGQACLADIGLVAARDQRTFVGTEGFVPPEGPGSAGADVYALGKVLYEMATGKDRLDFPELPDEPIPKQDTKRWLALNKVICETCDPRIKKRRYREAADLEQVLLLIHRAKRIQKKKTPLALPFATVGVTLGLLGFAFYTATPVVVNSSAGRIKAAPTRAFVTVASIPEGAEIYDGEGEPIGATPYGPKEFPFGSEVTFLLSYPGHKTAEITETLDEEYEIFNVTLERYPPEPGLEWRDFLGQRYFPEGNSHLSAYLVGPVEFKQSPAGDGQKWEGHEVSENGIKRRAAFVTPEQGEEFVRWLAEKSEADGVRASEYRFAVEFEDREGFLGVPQEVWDEGLRPFRVRVFPIQHGSLAFATEPPRAWVYLDDEYVGTTPLEEIAVFPGEYRLRAELDGYEDFETTVTVSEGQALTLPAISLRPTQGMPWQIPNWKNSLAMEFVEFSPDLLVARWETRVRDFREFVVSSEGVMPESPDFSQTEDHPVVNITRQHALDFCQWLTLQEREHGLIREWHEYRLPTDEEWSRMAGLDGEVGETPSQRALLESDGYPWGEDFPPAGKVVNIAGMEGAASRVPSKLVSGYNDGFPTTAPVGHFPPNELGIHDLGGNVREWVSDFYTTRKAGFGTSRGGSWKDYLPEHLRTGARRVVSEIDDGYGFRVVLAKVEQVDDKEEEPEDDEDGRSDDRLQGRPALRSPSRALEFDFGD
ncbi:SUMF1/EgtB/PvdO family nonheme iron enzyme [Roseibacillus ishigakijimensis]|uniref:SUMF1/EgtB/PvdO family nonheme iron enzyme n=1 Tax=Roseibacillus ishigakijimensis TaxID=454146 RepID=A0A934RQN5_9BACT|nr:SUMF1/EgtB/PvdO family nonheme iron enzyme [Roseibacillus ishigakijimensis]MBK1834102.1 SUMF1/EgtB/PvdO family nonheme iron enzyme [Roseibacillus ishigakijimensis]